jgi:hypothetical protein
MGPDDSLASKLLRHSDIRVTEKVYAPLGIDSLREAVEDTQRRRKEEVVASHRFLPVETAFVPSPATSSESSRSPEDDLQRQRASLVNRWNLLGRNRLKAVSRDSWMPIWLLTSVRPM